MDQPHKITQNHTRRLRLATQKQRCRLIQQLSPGDTTCIPNVRPIRTVPRFAKTADGLKTPTALTGNLPTAHELRLASATLTGTIGGHAVNAKRVAP